MLEEHQAISGSFLFFSITITRIKRKKCPLLSKLSLVLQKHERTLCVGKRKGENGKRSFVSMSSERQTKYGRSSYRLVREQRMLAKRWEKGLSFLWKSPFGCLLLHYPQNLRHSFIINNCTASIYTKHDFPVKFHSIAAFKILQAILTRQKM